MLTTRYRIALAVLMISCMASAAIAQQNYPEKAVRIVIPVGPGGLADGLPRQIAERLAPIWKQPVIVENRPGGNFVLATAFVAKQPADGYTMLLATDASFSINPHLIARIQYDAARDFAAVTQMVSLPIALVAHPSVSATNLAELVVFLKANPTALSYGSYGAGSSPHLAMESFKSQARVEILHVPYKGAADSVPAAIAGQVQFAFAGAAFVSRFIKEDRLKAIAIGGSNRSILLPNVPTFAEQGYPEVNASTWLGLVVPAGSPKETIAKINTEVVRIITEPTFRANQAANGVNVVASSPEEFGAFLIRDRENAGRAVKLAKLTAE